MTRGFGRSLVSGLQFGSNHSPVPLFLERTPLGIPFCNLTRKAVLEESGLECPHFVFQKNWWKTNLANQASLGSSGLVWQELKETIRVAEKGGESENSCLDWFLALNYQGRSALPTCFPLSRHVVDIDLESRFPPGRIFRKAQE